MRQVLPKKILKTKLRQFPFDFLTVIAALIAANLLVGSFSEQNIRQKSFEKISNQLECNEPLDRSLVILGDSRSARIDKNILAEAMGLNPDLCLNLSINSGCWVSSFSLLSKSNENLSENTKVLLCLSEYWLERPNLQDQSGFLSALDTYLTLGLYRDALSSILPLSAKRGSIVNKVRQWGESPFREGAENPVLDSPKFKGMLKSNIDLWFPPIQQEQLAENRDSADHILGKLKELAPNLVLLYLPNAKIRESYVDAHFPIRRKRFLAEIERLAAKHEFTFINLSGQMAEDHLYADFHHWNRTGVKIGTEIIAESLNTISRE
ncbi:MAG: hypothetical protein CMI31_06415 [Opitutae bacterium]|nr:hypothetical protein [Opitutae bacterium]|tara:strand:- start:866 stop:1831 length:966 start_codon:yes stop_codon:yes gene_type:complete